MIPRLVAYDQLGEQVDLYDFANHGKPVVIDMSAIWCDACKDLSLWLAGEPSNLDTRPDLEAIPGLVDAGEVFWITVVFEDAIGNAAVQKHAALWAEEFPHDRVAVLADDDRALYDYMFPGVMPSVLLLGEDMTVRAYDRFDYEVALLSLVDGGE